MLSPIFYAPIFYQLPKKPFFLTSQFIPSHTILNTFYKTKFSSLFFFFLLILPFLSSIFLSKFFFLALQTSLHLGLF
ncbi:hypothetical protein FTN73_00760 [Chlamydia trachomatis]|uniref:Uncharacterized protein n=3 Tax=Chlamydia trachomatis TaxID=813 RepID=A0A0H2X1X5_CHLTA|nr:hypothetical protein [Chlamydia trachomatis]ADH18471.1 hypothetical protein G9768_03970 [Chlamydia trachomatis G/9768]ADH19396.1 hypothetical protein G11222_03990 [Chlamydia trachomatis G/11222]ADH20317.1 hypothetical protein G11074_03965 [Chlamydia trachomatis G/11074]AAX51029.1 hypothetical protein CTA_0816 [Chlamydia trachomatis A/HAR-13]ADH97415.1 hypothetical protein CTG9301_03980 [Chlamydia trachomatis G/9301]